MDRKGKKNNKFRPGVVCPLVIHGESQPLYNVVAYRFPVLSVYFLPFFKSIDPARFLINYKAAKKMVHPVLSMG